MADWVYVVLDCAPLGLQRYEQFNRNRTPMFVFGDFSHMVELISEETAIALRGWAWMIPAPVDADGASIMEKRLAKFIYLLVSKYK